MTATSGPPASNAPPLTPEAVYGAIERFAPQARPYNYDDRFDCWGLVRAVYGGLLPGRPLDDDLDAATADESQRAALWAPIVDLADLLPGDVITTHDRHVAGEFHAVIFYGYVAGRPLVYDSSPRGEVPLLEEHEGGYAYVDARELFTRFARGTGGTDRLRDDGGSYLRLWFRGGRYYDRWLHERLAEANPGRETDAVALRRRAGLAPLPFYTLRRLAGEAGRERYDNRFTRRQNTYLPGDPPLLDDDYARVVIDGGETAPRPSPPAIVAAPAAAHAAGPATVEWRCSQGSDAAAGLIDRCRIELNELHRGVWKRLTTSTDVPVEGSFTVAAVDLCQDMCYEVALFAHGPAGWSTDAGVWFVNQPAADNPFLRDCEARPAGPAWSADEADPVPEFEEAGDEGGTGRGGSSSTDDASPETRRSDATTPAPPPSRARDPRFRPRAGGHS